MQGTEVTNSGRERKVLPSLSKSLLYGTSALAGVGLMVGGSTSASAQEEGIQLGLGGYLNSFMGIADIDEADDTDADFNDVWTHFDGEVFFEGKTVLENGLEVGAQAQLELPTSGDTIDEAYLWLEGAFGLINFGGENSAAYKMGLGGSSGVGIPINSGWVSQFVPPPAGFRPGFRSPSVSTSIDIQNDEMALTYYTPRVAGFQFGASYVPNSSFAGNPTNGIVDKDGFNYYNGVSVGANFVQEFGGFNFGVSGGYAVAQAGDAIEAAGGDDIEQLMVGGTFGFGGLTFNAAYADELEGRVVSPQGAALRTTEGHSWIGSVIYEIGPWGVSVAYFHGETEDLAGVAGDDQQDAAAGSVTYAIGPGIALDGTISWAEYEREGGADDQSGIAGAVGVQLGF